MLLSIALIIILSLFLAQIFSYLKLPKILGMIIAGVILGPFVLDLINSDILNISADLRQIALVVILIRAGLSLDLDDLKKVGKQAIFLAYISASVEMIAITLFAHLFFDISFLDAALMGAVVAAVSPAVIVPKMLHLLSDGYGHDKKIPQLILAGASVDNVFILIIFASLLQFQQGSSLSVMTFLNIPIAVFLGISLGIVTGIVLVYIFKKLHARDTLKVLIIFSVGFLIIALEHALTGIIPISGILAVITLAVTILKLHEHLAKRLVLKFEKIWVIAEIMLFVLVGAIVDISVMTNVGLIAIALIFIAMTFRMIGVLISLIKSPLNQKEKLFVGFSYMPKATVQAAIGAIPLALGLSSGLLILTVAVLAILITAPIGAILIDVSHQKLLKQHNIL